MARKTERKRLRKQPKRRRTHSEAGLNLPRVTMPDTAKQRRRRQQTRFLRGGLSTLRRLLFTSRWISLGLLALTVYALMIIAQEERFFLTYLPVEGTISIPPEEIVAASGLAGHHIFAADPAAAATQIDELPGVVSSTVTLQWPNQVYIAVGEEKPVAVWVENGTEYGITESGRFIPLRISKTGLLRIISEIPAAPGAAEGAAGSGEDAADGANGNPELLPTPTPAPMPVEAYAAPAAEGAVDGEPLAEDGEPVPTPAPLSPIPPASSGLAPAGEASGIATVSELGTSLPFMPPEVLQAALQLQELRPEMDQLYYRPAGGLSYQDERGWRVYFGSGSGMQQKLAVYEAMVENLQSLGIQPAYISVSNQEKPFYRAQ